ncbi:hemophore-related protein [Mycolicibacterium arenosum]|uniref:Hemophore-related protein n=1 Tax=Mycolicibacterium arenosum TaxID=2952157 RepID=A0ABT1LYI3_9MYCO|nr:hemophore-related protein [Mycolicibacterium sp. CAU 1645]MCP9271963.1 hemophore-related protein [Mycolicibacterium sp. CAU 1645]
MLTISLKRSLVAAVGAAALSLSVGGGVANADPIIDTTCTYPQVIAALNTENPTLAAKFASNPVAAGMLTNFLSAPPAERQKLATNFQQTSWGQKYFGAMSAIAGVCNNY